MRLDGWADKMHGNRRRRAGSAAPKSIGVGDLRLGPRERRYLAQVVASNRLSYGDFSERFERLFGKLHQCKHAIFCSSGTAALHLAVAALREKYGWKDGDEVIVPAVTFVATSNVLLHHRLKPVFVDVDPRTYNIDPRLIERRITRRTRAIIPVHLMGLPSDMREILEIASRNDLSVVEDSCETMFASYRGRKVGSFGDIGCFSTYVAHYIVAGIGGFATTNDPELALALRSLMNHGRDNIYTRIDDDESVSRKRLFEIVARRFSFVRLGYNYRATELEAAIGLAQLENYQAIVAKRVRNAMRLMQGLSDLSDRLQPPTVPGDREHVFMLFPLVVRSGSKRNLVNYLEDRGIETRDLLPLLSQPVYRRLFGRVGKEYPVARWLNRSGFYVGCHQYLTNDDIDYMIDTIQDYFRRAK